jgi:probable HAF family extracellular repeat protein
MARPGAINDEGQVIGTVTTKSGDHAVLWTR